MNFLTSSFRHGRFAWFPTISPGISTAENDLAYQKNFESIWKRSTRGQMYMYLDFRIVDWIYYILRTTVIKSLKKLSQKLDLNYIQNKNIWPRSTTWLFYSSSHQRFFPFLFLCFLYLSKHDMVTFIDFSKKRRKLKLMWGIFTSNCFGVKVLQANRSQQF